MVLLTVYKKKYSKRTFLSKSLLKRRGIALTLLKNRHEKERNKQAPMSPKKLLNAYNQYGQSPELLRYLTTSMTSVCSFSKAKYYYS